MSHAAEKTNKKHISSALRTNINRSQRNKPAFPVYYKHKDKQQPRAKQNNKPRLFSKSTSYKHSHKGHAHYKRKSERSSSFVSTNTNYSIRHQDPNNNFPPLRVHTKDILTPQRKEPAVSKWHRHKQTTAHSHKEKSVHVVQALTQTTTLPYKGRSVHVIQALLQTTSPHHKGRSGHVVQALPQTTAPRHKDTRRTPPPLEPLIRPHLQSLWAGICGPHPGYVGPSSTTRKRY